MNKYQRRESKAVRRMMAYCSIRSELDADYKSVRRKMRKTLQVLTKVNQKAHKDVIKGIDLANGSDQTVYIRGEK
mgnify:CR=1 FL=1